MAKHKVVKKYIAKLDSKKRLTIRESQFDHYSVNVMDNGEIVLKPRILVDPNKINDATLKSIETSMINLKKGIVGKSFNPDEFDWETEK